jgi:hypothetical protein
MEERGQLHAPTGLSSEKHVPVPIGMSVETSGGTRFLCFRFEVSLVSGRRGFLQ